MGKLSPTQDKCHYTMGLNIVFKRGRFMDWPEDIKPGDCVKLPDGRIARIRDNIKGVYRIRVRRKTSQAHQFLEFDKEELTKVECPEGWMSPEGYNRYLKITLEKMQARNRKTVR